MKLVLLYFLCVSSWASSMSLVGPCSETPAFEDSLPIVTGESVGAYTVRFLDHYGIDYVGSELGMSSILNTPTGKDAMEVINSDPNHMELNSYGWCYSVNGVAPDVYPSEVEIQEGDIVKWWFGYASFRGGQWITQCRPSYLRKPDFLCKN